MTLWHYKVRDQTPDKYLKVRFSPCTHVDQGGIEAFRGFREWSCQWSVMKPLERGFLSDPVAWIHDLEFRIPVRDVQSDRPVWCVADKHAVKVPPEGTVSKSRERGFPFPYSKHFGHDDRSVELDCESFPSVEGERSTVALAHTAHLNVWGREVLKEATRGLLALSTEDQLAEE